MLDSLLQVERKQTVSKFITPNSEGNCVLVSLGFMPIEENAPVPLKFAKGSLTLGPKTFQLSLIKLEDTRKKVIKKLLLELFASPD